MDFIADEQPPLTLKSRLDTAWKTKERAETCGILIQEVMPRCVKWLLNKFNHQGLSEEDCEDCFDAGVEGLLRRQPSEVNDPYNYVFTSAKNAAFDILDERKKFVLYDPELLEGDDGLSKYDDGDLKLSASNWSFESMLIIAEATLDVELTARDEQLLTLFRITLPKLSPNRRRLVEELLEHGATTSNSVLADIMDSSETAIKSLKSRTFDDLRRLLPISADELDINFDSLLSSEPEVWVRKLNIPSDEAASC